MRRAARLRGLAALCLAAPVPFLQGCLRARPGEADLILTHGLVRPFAGEERKASALAVRNGRVIAVGDDAAILALRGARTPVIDLQGRTVIPGLIDPHVRLVGVGEALLNEARGQALYLDLTDTQSEEDAVQRVRTRARDLKAGEWIVGRGWDQEVWTDRRLPDKRLLSDIVQYNPVFLVRSDAHAVWVNQKALDLAGIKARTADPPGGRIVRLQHSGEPSGILLERAWEPVYRLLPRPTPEERTGAILEALRHYASLGCTFVGSVGSFDHLGLLDSGARGDEEAGAFRAVALSGLLPIRVSLMIPGPSEAAEALLQRGPETGVADGRLDLSGISLVADGALGSRGAALLQPYSDEASEAGILRMDEAALAGWAARCLRRGIQVAVEAQGDAGVRAAAQGLAAALAPSPGADARFRIDALALFDPADLEVMVRARTIAVVEPRALVPGPDGPLEERRVGQERAARLYAFGTLLEANVPLAASSARADGPPDPWAAIYAAVTRRTPGEKPQGGWHSEQRLKRSEALRLFTLGAAYAVHHEKEAGSLEPGKWADFVILSRDILTVPDEEILKTEVQATYVGGHEVYRRPTVGQSPVAGRRL